MRPLSVLIVDDETAACENMADILEMAGHRVTWSANPSQAWSRCQQQNERFDLAILDLKMPEMNGVELLKKLRGIQPELPAILTTAYTHTDDFKTEDRHLFEAVLSKPVDIELLLRRVKKKDFPLVICVDDDPEFCDTLAEILASQRIECICCHDFESARSQLADKDFDVALLDFRLPDTSGIDAAKSLQQINPRIKSFLITGYPTDIASREENIAEVGISQVFEKPLQPEELLRTIARLQP